MIKSSNIIPKIIGLFVILFNIGLYSQTIVNFTLENGEGACATSSFNSFKFSFEPKGVFGANNMFVLELSDADGTFPANPYELKRIGNVGFVRVVESSFSVPTHITYGVYKMRVTSTNHTSVFSNVLDDVSMSYRDLSSGLVLEGENGERDVVVCPNGSQVITLSGIANLNEYEYRWYKDFNLISGETGTSITVAEEGEYWAKPYLGEGNCTDSNTSNPPSNKVKVTKFPNVDIQIQGANVVEVCANEDYDLVATIDDNSYTYRWYLNDALITDNVQAYQPVYTMTNNQFGKYRVEIESVSGCISKSQEVEVKQKVGVNFDVNIVGAATQVMLPMQGIKLAVEHTANNATFRWFKNGEPLNKKQATLSIFDEQIGEYFVEVTDNSGTCPTVIRSDSYTILGVKNFSIELASNSYEPCTFAKIDMKAIVNVIATDDNEYGLTSDQIELLSFQWFKGVTELTGATTDKISLASYLENDEYRINVSVGRLSEKSEPFNVLLTPKVELQSSSPSNKLCTGSSITLSVDIINDFTYKWYKETEELTVADVSNVVVTEIGTYKVTYEGFGCLKEIEVVIEEFDDSVVEISPSTTVVVEIGDIATATATGADFYEWYNEEGSLVSSSDVLETDVIGTYTLIAKVGECAVEKKIEVVEDDGNIIIPNILTPFNGDGVNDTWKLPNKYSYQNGVQVIIYNSEGKELLNTTDYQNNWPEDNNLKDGMLFYFKVIKEDTLVKAGTISVLK